MSCVASVELSGIDMSIPVPISATSAAELHVRRDAIDLVLEAAIAFGIRAAMPPICSGRAVREDEVGPDDEDALLAERHLGIVAPEQL